MREPNTPVGIADDSSDGIDTDRLIARCLATDKHCRVGGLWAFVAQVVGERTTGWYRTLSRRAAVRS